MSGVRPNQGHYKLSRTFGHNTAAATSAALFLFLRLVRPSMCGVSICYFVRFCFCCLIHVRQMQNLWRIAFQSVNSQRTAYTVATTPSHQTHTTLQHSGVHFSFPL